MPPDAFRITQTVPGGEPVDLTEAVTSASWSSGLPGGFGSASLIIPRLLTQKERGLLGGITIEHDGRVLFEGQVEDAFTSGERGSVSTELQAFGLQRLLASNSVRRAWSLRNSPQPVQAGSAKGSSALGTLVIGAETNYIVGYYDTNTYGATPFAFGARFGVQVPASLECAQVALPLPAGIPGARLMFDAILLSGATATLLVHSSSDGVNYTRHFEQQAGAGLLNVSVDVALVQGATDIRITAAATGGPAGGVEVQASNIRVLGTSLREDSAGGFYGGTILRDVVASVDGIYPGTIESGSDFVLAEIERVNRSSVLSVVQEINRVYVQDWAVWEGGRFDWTTPDLKSPGWLVPLEKATAWRIEQSTDGVSKRVYVTFTDAADQQQKEASAESTNNRNPFVRTGQAADVVVSAPTPMTSITAPLLAAKLSNDSGRWPDIKGSLTLLAGTMITHSNSARTIPALAIRAGDNVTIRDLPIEDIYAAGQDGQTVFRVTGVRAATDATVQLDLEGVTRRADVLLARLGAVS